MTEEEIRPIAENYVEEYCHCSDGEYTDGSLVCAGIGTALIVSRQLEKRIAELEKENAELKGIKDVATLIRANNDTVTTLMQLNNMLVSRNQQLTKATELLRKLVLEVKGYEEIYGYDTCEPVQEAEQFLSEVEK